MKQDKLVTFYDDEQDNSDFPPEDLDGFIKFLERKRKEIPEEYRDTARVELYSKDYPDIGYIKITYIRPETDEEEQNREQQEQRRKDEVRQKELYQLEKLKAKYGR